MAIYGLPAPSLRVGYGFQHRNGYMDPISDA